MNKPKLCVVVMGETLDKFLFQLEKAQAVADFVELRVDYIKAISPEMLRTIAKQAYKKTILCCRSEENDGKFLGTREEQNRILQMGNDLGFHYLDIDLEMADKIIIKNKKAKIIISYHNFKETPDLSELENMAERMRVFHPDILKFAVMTKSQNDVNALFKFLINKNDDEKMIVLGMGAQGKITRWLAPLLGGYLTFASIEKASSAPGQIDVQTMQDVYRKL